MFINIFLIWASQTLFCSQAFDQIYRFKTFAPVVLKNEKNIVYQQYLEKLITEFIQSKPRYHLAKGFEESVALWQKQNSKIIEEKDLTIREISPLLIQLSSKNIDSLLLGYIDKEQLRFSLMNTKTFEIIQSVSEKLEDNQFETIKELSQKKLEELFQSIIFDITLQERRGYTVLLDQGLPLKVGQKLQTWTVERNKQGLTLEETGVVEITQVFDTFSEARILVEKKPKEVTAWNKVKIEEPTLSRETASVIGTAQTRELGKIHFNVGASVANLSQSYSDSPQWSDKISFPTALLKAHILLTEHIFIQPLGKLAMSSISYNDQSFPASLKAYGIETGYLIGDPKSSHFYGKTGYLKHTFDMQTAPNEPLGLLPTSYSGIIIGGGTYLPLVNAFAINFDIHSFLFISSTRDEKSIAGSGWQFSILGEYTFSPSLGLEAGMRFENYKSEINQTIKDINHSVVMYFVGIHQHL